LNIAIGSENKAKNEAVMAIVNQFTDADFTSLSVSSDVSEQPLSDEETRTGAINRALNALRLTNADAAFGLEGGVREIHGELFVCNWGAMALKNGEIFTAGGAQIRLPEDVAVEIRKGRELGPVMDEYTNRKDIRSHEGAVGVFTDGLVNRQTMFEHVVRLVVGQYLYALKTN
jgi:inosine/xanthosine triphosphatase